MFITTLIFLAPKNILYTSQFLMSKCALLLAMCLDNVVAGITSQLLVKSKCGHFTSSCAMSLDSVVAGAAAAQVAGEARAPAAVSTMPWPRSETTAPRAVTGRADGD